MLKYCWIVIGIFYTAAAVIKFSKHKGKDKSVNLALETVFEFDNDDKITDVNILNKVQHFIGNVKNVIEENNVGRRLMRNNKGIFSDFLVNLIQTLVKYEDYDLENLVSLIGNEIKKPQYKDSKFYELTATTDLQKVFIDTFAKLGNKSAADIRQDLEALSKKLIEENYEKNEGELWDTVNSMYQEDSVAKFNQFITDLDDYRLKSRKNIDLSQIVREGLKEIMFDHYSNVNINLRASLMDKLQNYLQYYYDNLLQYDNKYKRIQSTPKPTQTTSQRTQTTSKRTQTMSEMSTQRQIYVEKLNLRNIKKKYEQWLKELRSKISSTPHITRRPHSVPTTTKSKSLTKDDVNNNDDDTTKKHKKYRFVKVSTRSKTDATPAYKERVAKTTKERRTLRQMYVEKNLDLKYDPDAYEYLTTNIKRKTKTLASFTSPTTRRSHIYNKNKRHSHKNKKTKKYVQKHDTFLSDESNVKYDKKDTESDGRSDELSDRKTSSKNIERPKYKVTQMVRKFGETFDNKELDYDYKWKPQLTSQNKNTTSNTIKPTFTIEWTRTSRLNSKLKSASPRAKHKRKIVNHVNSDNKELYTTKPGHPNVIELVKNIDYTIDIKKASNFDLSDQQPEVHKYGYKNKDYRSHNSKTFKSRTQKTTTPNSAHVPVLRRQDKELLRVKLKMSRDPLILPQYYDTPPNVARHLHRRFYTQSTIISQRGLSIEVLSKRNKYYRRNDNSGTTVNSDNNTNVIGRIQKLENELELVKMHISNDTKRKDLRNDRNEKHTSSSENSLVTQVQISTDEINPKTNIEIDNTMKLKNNNAYSFSKVIPETYENSTTKLSQISNDEKQVIEPNYDTNRFETDLKNDIGNSPLNSTATRVSKEASTFGSHNIEQGRKNFQNSNQLEEIKTNKENLNNESSNSHTSNIKANKQIDGSSSESRINKIDSEQGTVEKVFRANEEISEKGLIINENIKNKYSSTISLLKNGIISNQSESRIDKNWVEVIFRGKEYKNKNDDVKVKSNDIAEYLGLPDAKSESQLNSTKELKYDFKGDSTDIAFRARDDETAFTPSNTLTGFTTKPNNLSKANKELTTENIIIKALQETKIPKTKSSDSKAISGKLVKPLVIENGVQLASLPKANDGDKKHDDESEKNKESVEIIT